MQQNLSVITTADGSHSIFNSLLKEHYHSVHGAINESQHVFIEAGLKKILEQKTKINLLEVGLGTGLNVLLTAICLEENNIDKQIYYTAIEPYPLSKEIISQLNYKELFKSATTKKNSDTIHESEFGETHMLASNLSFIKTHNTLQQTTFNTTFDLVYFDAFAPSKQPELWSIAIFEKLFNCMNTDSILVTYCAKGEVKRNLKAAGFIVETLPGPPGKREMTRAKKK